MSGLAEIVRALGGDLYAGGRRANVPAPGHSAADRSVSLLLAGDRLIIHGFGGADWRVVRDDLRQRGFIDRDGRLTRGAVAPSPAPRHTAATRRDAARALWAAAGPIPGTLSEQHLRRRAVASGAVLGLRHHSAAPAAVYDGRGPFRPALLAAVRDLAGAVCAVEVTYLAADGGRARLRLARKTVGVLPAGSAVRLWRPGPILIVAEGVFSALSAAERLGGPAWALLSTSNLRRWSPPAGVSRVLIAGDRGSDGERSAGVLATRLSAAGVEVALRWPPRPYGDWNEAAVAAREDGGGWGPGEPGDREVRIGGSELDP